MSGFSTPCSSMFMLPMARHGGVEVVAVEGALVEPAAGLGVLVDAVAVVLDEMLGGRDEEAGRAASDRR